jgi:hypothetical protein
MDGGWAYFLLYSFACLAFMAFLVGSFAFLISVDWKARKSRSHLHNGQ